MALSPINRMQIIETLKNYDLPIRHTAKTASYLAAMERKYKDLIGGWNTFKAETADLGLQKSVHSSELLLKPIDIIIIQSNDRLMHGYSFLVYFQSFCKGYPRPPITADEKIDFCLCPQILLLKIEMSFRKGFLTSTLCFLKSVQLESFCLR